MQNLCQIYANHAKSIQCISPIRKKYAKNKDLICKKCKKMQYICSLWSICIYMQTLHRGLWLFQHGRPAAGPVPDAAFCRAGPGQQGSGWNSTPAAPNTALQIKWRELYCRLVTTLFAWSFMLFKTPALLDHSYLDCRQDPFQMIAESITGKGFIKTFPDIFPWYIVAHTSWLQPGIVRGLEEIQ